MSSQTYTSGTSGRSLVIIHGRDFKPPGEDLLGLIDAALAAGVERDYPDVLADYQNLAKDLAYYGDLTNAFLAGKGGKYDEQLDLGDRRNALHLLRQIDKRKKFGIQRYDNLPGKSAIPEFAADIAAPILSAIGLASPLIGRLAKDLGEYWNTKNDFGTQLRQRVRATLCAAMDKDDPILLISHGLGCIIAYDVIWELSHDPELSAQYANRKIDMWLTLGAPLGDSSIRKKLLGAKEKAGKRYPNNIMSWHNVSAEDDYTCHDNTLADDFKVMLKEKLVSCIRDYQIYNLAIRYGKSNPHSSVGYYIHPRVSQIIADWLTQGAMD
jgi:hypothetical protein